MNEHKTKTIKSVGLTKTKQLKLTQNHMRCDNHCSRFGKTDELINYAIFKCPPTLQTWVLVWTLSCPSIFPIASVYSN